MLEIINDNIIRFTKGDSIALDVDLRNTDGTKYTMQEGDCLKMTIRKSISETPIATATSTIPKIILDPTITSEINAGKYCYDIELNTADNDVYTIIGIRHERERNLIVFPEVTTRDE